MIPARAPAGRSVVAMSGGVDSSVCAALIAEAGLDAVGLSMRLYDASGRDMGRCCTPADLMDARQVAAGLGLPHYVMDFVEDFRVHVLDYFASEYRQGRTPIPCIPCNSTLKFGRLLERARMLGATRVVTGHYARVEHVAARGRYRLRAGVDRDRDQSYFLFDLTQEQLAAAEFPLGSLQKSEVRELARRFGLECAEKSESRDLCFVGSGTYRDHLPEQEGGEIVDRSGSVLGTHSGVSGFTVGQRRGLGVPASRRLYVLALDPARRQVVVGEEEEQYAMGLTASRANWIFCERPTVPFRARARLRYRHGGAGALVHPTEDGFRLKFDEAQRAVTPGQAVVLYDGDEVLGGAWIDASTVEAAPAPLR